MDRSSEPGRPYAEMTVAQLKQELEARGIDTKVGSWVKICIDWCKFAASVADAVSEFG
jgi:hypothetical protein